MAKVKQTRKFVVKGIDLTSVFKQDSITNDTELRAQLAKTRKAMSKLEKIRLKMDGAMKDLEAADKLGNFEIQDLMSDYNEAEALITKVGKRLDGLINCVICKT